MENKPDNFEVLNVIGTGSFGTCYKVQEKSSGKIYVWKAIDYGAMSEDKKILLVSEVNLLSELQHPNIVQYYDHIIHKSTTTLYIIMEWCEGGDLATLINSCKSMNSYLEEAFIWRVLYQTGRALQACHSYLAKGTVLHRDIKPANVFLDAVGNVKLGDFGLARILKANVNYAQTLVGTPYYMSPEVIKGGKYNKKSDIWSLGCLVYEMCTLIPPFVGTNIKQLAHKIKGGRFNRIPSHYSEDLHKMISFMLSVEHMVRPTVEVILHHPTVVSHLAQETLKLIKFNDGDSESSKSSKCNSLEKKLNKVGLECAETEAKPKEGATIGKNSARPQHMWSCKLELLKQRELAVRAKEHLVNERERVVAKREKEVAIMDRLIKDKMSRADIYLRQCRDARSVASSARNVQQRYNTVDADLDTSFSADPGDNSLPLTAAKINPELIEKPVPFIRTMSQRRHVHFGTLPSMNTKKSATALKNSENAPKLATWHRYLGKNPSNVLHTRDKKLPLHSADYRQVNMPQTQKKNENIEETIGKCPSQGLDKAVEDNFRNGVLSVLNSNRSSSETISRPTSWLDECDLWLENKRFAYNLQSGNKENVGSYPLPQQSKKKHDVAPYDTLTRKMGALGLR